MFSLSKCLVYQARAVSLTQKILRGATVVGLAIRKQYYACHSTFEANLLPGFQNGYESFPDCARQPTWCRTSELVDHQISAHQTQLKKL